MLHNAKYYFEVLTKIKKSPGGMGERNKKESGRHTHGYREFLKRRTVAVGRLSLRPTQRHNDGEVNGSEIYPTVWYLVCDNDGLFAYL